MSEQTPEAVAENLYITGKAHALSALLLHKTVLDEATAEGREDPEKEAFNGGHSASVHLLVGLAFELYLKSAYVIHGGDHDAKHLRNVIGHDLRAALNLAEERGFTSEAPYLRDIIEVLREPHLTHHFRYERPAQIALPAPADVFAAFEVLDSEIEAALAEFSNEPA